MYSLISVAVFSVILLLVAWYWQKRHANAGIVDVAWAFGMLFAGLLYSFTGVAPLVLKVCLGVLTFCWYFRLGYHLQKRVLSEAEDGRYFAMRLAMKEWAQYGFLLFFIVQAGFICLLSLPFWAVAQHTQPHTYFVIAALLIASFALYGVKTTDHQLAEFRHNPENQGLTCCTGWWRYSRHPNYFFEWLHWFAYPLMGWGGEYHYALWAAPIVMFIFLYWLTGIPFTEQQALRSRGDNYRLYQKTTSVFFPWWPKMQSDKQS